MKLLRFIGPAMQCEFDYFPVSSAEGVIAGGTAGVVVETALYPIDTIKTRLQVIQFSHHAVLQVSTFDHHI